MNSSVSLKAIGVTHLRPGFFDDQAFIIRLERSGCSALLDYYALYVDSVSLESAYLDAARPTILDVTEFLLGLLRREAHQGLCMQVALLLSRFLERQGVWNYIVRGGAIVRFPSETGIRPHIFAPEDGSGGTFGHAWVVAPPFRIIDLTICNQYYSQSEQQYLQTPVVTEAAPTCMPPNGFAPKNSFSRRFPSRSTRLAEAEITYTPFGIGGPAEDEPFEKMRCPVLDGLSPFHACQDYQRRLVFETNPANREQVQD